MLRQLEHALWLASSAGAADGGAFSRAQWDWALSVVHSRTFGAPGPAGGVGVRMLVPLVDMLNHAGDSVTSVPGAAAPAPAVQAFENVRWAGCAGMRAGPCIGGQRPAVELLRGKPQR